MSGQPVAKPIESPAARGDTRRNVRDITQGAVAVFPRRGFQTQSLVAFSVSDGMASRGLPFAKSSFWVAVISCAIATKESASMTA